METNHEDRWVAGRLATLAPTWRPDFVHGRRLLDAGIRKRAHSWHWMAAAAAVALCIVALAIPHGLMYAQQLWHRLVLKRVDVVRLDLSHSPLRARVTTNGLEQTVQNLDEAELKAGFRPDLPSAGVLPMKPVIKVTGQIDLEQTIHVPDIKAALQKLGASDVQVPTEWEGMQLRTEIGPTVTADYADVQIIETRPFELSIPPGFPLEAFAEVAFRSLGVSAWEARALAQKFVANPAWLLDIPADEIVNVQEVALRTGPAMLIESFDNRGKIERATVIRNTSDRIYAVSAKTRPLALRIAGTLP